MTRLPWIIAGNGSGGISISSFRQALGAMRRGFCTRGPPERYTPLQFLNYNVVGTFIAISFGLSLANGYHYAKPKEYLVEPKPRDDCQRELLTLLECTRTLKDAGGCDGLYGVLARCREKGHCSEKK